MNYTVYIVHMQMSCVLLHILYTVWIVHCTVLHLIYSAIHCTSLPIPRGGDRKRSREGGGNPSVCVCNVIYQ